MERCNATWITESYRCDKEQGHAGEHEHDLRRPVRWK